MDTYLQSINTYLSQQPWWVIASGSVLLFLIIKKLFTGSKASPIMDLRAQLHASNTSSYSIPVSAKTTEFKFEGENLKKIQVLLQKDNKIGAIKLVRELTDCDLVTAKNLVEGMAKSLVS